MRGVLPLEEIQKNFKVGDTVKLINKSSKSADIGATAVVIGYINAYYQAGFYYLEIKWARNGLDHDQDNGAYFAQDFIVVSKSSEKETSKKCPVCGGELKDKYSEYVGENIKKCSSCGWC